MKAVAMSREFVESIRNKVKVGDIVKWVDGENYVSTDKEKVITARVKEKYPYFCVTSVGTVQWGTIAGYMWRRGKWEDLI